MVRSFKLIKLKSIDCKRWLENRRHYRSLPKGGGLWCLFWCAHKTRQSKIFLHKEERDGEGIWQVYRQTSYKQHQVGLYEWGWASDVHCRHGFWIGAGCKGEDRKETAAPGLRIHQDSGWADKQLYLLVQGRIWLWSGKRVGGPHKRNCPCAGGSK